MLEKINELQHDERLNRKKVRIVNFISFLLGFSSAITAYILSSYFKEVSGIDNVSVFFLGAYVIILIALLNFHKLIRRFGKSFVFIALLILFVISSLTLSLLSTSWVGVVIVIVNITFFDLCLVGKDIILESYSIDKLSGRIRGLHLTLMNIGFLLGPFVATQILNKFNFQIIFLVQFVFGSIIFIITWFNFRKVNHKFHHDVTVMNLLKKIIRRKNVLRIYYISTTLDFFYFIMVVYTPIYLRNLGLEWTVIGFIFSFMLLPFVFLQYPAGQLADKKIGEKELIIFALLVMGVSTGFIYFINSTSAYVWAAILFSTRIGAALIEVLQDSYFYKRIDGADVDIIDFFRTARPVGFFSAAILSAGLLLIFPVKVVFIMGALVIFSSLYPALRLVDNLSEDELLAIEKNK